MQRHLLLLALLGMFAAALLTPAPARAILIETGSTQVGGYLISDDGKTLKLRVGPEGSEKNVDFEKAKIKIIHQFDRARLEKLNKDEPKGYADLAESLAAFKADPEARDVAMRLYLIAAYLDKAQFGAKSLLRMSSLAGSPAEARRCRAMAFLLDPNADAAMLRVEAAKPQPRDKAQLGVLQDLLKALQFYRTGQLKLAKEVADRKGLDKIFSAAPGLTSQVAFQQRCNDAFCATCKTKGTAKCSMCNGTGRTVNEFGQQQVCTRCKGQRTTTCDTCEGQGVNQAIIDENLRVVLRAELWALDRLSGAGDTAKRGDSSWTSVIQSRQVSPAGSLSLETITEFDPRKCVYRGGVWVEK